MYYYFTDELYHSGILGMKWGKRNGPPYPLSGNAHSASEKKAGINGWSNEAKQQMRNKRVARKAAKVINEYAKRDDSFYKKDADELNKAIEKSKKRPGKLSRAKEKVSSDLKKLNKDDIDFIGKTTKKITSATAKGLREASKETRPTGIKPASEMSNKELQDFLTRKNLEERYEKYTKETVTKRPGLKTAADVLEDLGGLAITTLSAIYLVKKIKGN